MSNYKIAILGAGNVGYQLTWHLNNNGHRIVQVYSRHLPAAKWVGNLMDIPFTSDINQLATDADLYFIAVNDDSVPEVARQLRLGDKVVAHTSGAVPMNILEGVSSNYGIFYPLQTLSRNISVDFSVIPICMNGVNDYTRQMLQDVASSLTRKVVIVDDEKRLAIHVAAVIANNFTNHLFSISQIILERNGLSFEILKPLINETVRKIQNHEPLNVQTGPAIRGDEETIRKHLGFLQNDERFKEIYRLMSNSILELSEAHAEPAGAKTS
ncbi:MAG: DUF2520 domain-containing protein [Chitinophagales bacterium]|nr:DUF2520 domain-containing protein [Bacteroidota bacterium]MBX7140981.1 DUF2520 domain-containing protein [Chitinophagales bacterium]